MPWAVNISMFVDLLFLTPRALITFSKCLIGEKIRGKKGKSD